MVVMPVEEGARNEVVAVVITDPCELVVV